MKLLTIGQFNKYLEAADIRKIKMSFDDFSSNIVAIQMEFDSVDAGYSPNYIRLKNADATVCFSYVKTIMLESGNDGCDTATFSCAKRPGTDSFYKILIERNAV